LNTDPTPAPAKRSNNKSRPASVGSLGSILQQQQQKKHPHQLKNRAAIASTSLSSKKIKPSQSMPLYKKTATKKKSTSPLKSEEDMYSSTAYINSNITLNKAFRQRGVNGQMASLIPIASRALTTTKSV
jgi:hypothetical protein